MPSSALSAAQEQLLACLVERLADDPAATIAYESEWFGELPFGQYHWLQFGDGTRPEGLPADWERDDLLALERSGLLVRISEWSDPREDDHVRFVFRLDRGRLVALVEQRLGGGADGVAAAKDGGNAEAGPGQPASSVRVGLLAVAMPGDYRLDRQAQRSHAMHGPAGMTADEDHALWVGSGDRRFSVTWWTPMAPYPGGPMQAAREWPAVVAGQATTIIETRVFMGQSQRVMVSHLRFAAPPAQVLVTGDGMEQPEFARLLGGIAPVR